MEDHLNKHIWDHRKLGCTECFLGIQMMPEGYVLMLDADDMYYYWLRRDGEQSAIHWNRWAVYRWAKTDSAHNSS